jgi:general nucleoside transport system ATP-binding protein
VEQEERAGSAPAVELVGITKRFPGVVANEDVTLRVMPASIHAIVGENGAGKSTLMKILYGMQPPDEGRILMDGREVRFRSPRDAIEAGIGMVHQHFMLAGQLTVLENMVLGSEPRRGIQIDFSAAKRRILELADTYGLDVDPEVLVEELTVGERQRVEILKVLYRGARILILDEPTAVLVPQEVDELFASMRELTREGVTIMFISHKLDEVLSVADEITVIRDGRTVDTVLPNEVDARKLAELMVGSELPTPETGPSTVTDRVELELDAVTVVGDQGRAVLSDIDLRAHGGEVVGIAGVEGNGQTPLVEVIMGMRAPTSGRVFIGGEDATSWPTLKVRESGVGLIPEDRTSQGLILPAPLWENVMLGHQSQVPFRSGMWIDRRAAKARTEEVIRAFDVRTPGVDVPALALSGGNQQKLAVGREMLSNPKVLVASQPTRGIDVGAQAAIWEQIKDAREAGLAVLLISADLEELIGLSDRLYVIFRGRLVAELDPATVTAEELGSYMTGAQGGAVA